MGSAFDSEDPDSTYATLRRLEVRLQSGRLGSEFVRDYEDEGSGGALKTIVASDPEIGLEVLRLVLGAMPLIRAVGGRDLLEDREPARVADELVKRTLRLTAQLRERDDGALSETLERIDEFVKACRGGTVRDVSRLLGVPGSRD